MIHAIPKLTSDMKEGKHTNSLKDKKLFRVQILNTSNTYT